MDARVQSIHSIKLLPGKTYATIYLSALERQRSRQLQKYIDLTCHVDLLRKLKEMIEAALDERQSSYQG